MTDVQSFHSDFENKWCPGCGNFGILQSLKKALADLDISPQDILIVSGIGQAAKTPHFLQCNAFHGLHGRALPVATGAKIANHDLTIVVHMGDGDCFAEGGNHFMHTVRRNIDLTLLAHDNRVFGLTKGQASPTAEYGFVTKSHPLGVLAIQFNSLAVALSLGAGFVARGYSGKTDHLSKLIQKGIEHKGFSFIDVLQPCVTFNHLNTWQWYNERVYFLEETDYSPNDRHAAIAKSEEWGDKIPLGIFYKSDERKSFTDHLSILEKGSLLNQPYNRDAVRKIADNL